MIIQAQDYKVEIAPVLLSGLQVFLTGKQKYSNIFVLVDENTHEHCLSYLMYQISGLETAQIIEIPSGEENKTLEICYQVWQTLTENHADRNSLLINLGGGVIGDMGGFIASAYKRGIDFIQIPTTLLSQVDASTGGKVAVDFEGFKNQIGLFSNPKAVFVDTTFMETLEERQIISGLAEMLKHGLISDKSHWEKLKEFKKEDVLSENFKNLVAESINLKNQVVLEDPKEVGQRKVLNFGHTIGHAVETYFLTKTDTLLLHGEAVTIGMICESYLSQSIGFDVKSLREVIEVVDKNFSLPKLDESSFEEVLMLMQNDKKNQEGKLNFTLLKSIGEATFDNFISEEEVVKSLQFYNQTIA